MATATDARGPFGKPHSALPLAAPDIRPRAVRPDAAREPVHDGPAAYSVLVALPGGAAGLLYERGERSPYERITFTRFGLDWLQ